MKALVLITIICCILPTAASDVITGKTVDSVTGLAVSGVIVSNTSPACTTKTDTGGNFKLIIPTTGTKTPPTPKIGKVSYQFDENAKYEIISLSGKTAALTRGPFRLSEIVHMKNISSGVFFVRVSSENKSAIYKIMTANPYSSNLEATMVESSSQNLAKVAAVSYVINFQRTNYESGTLTVSGSTSNLIKKLSPVSTNTSANIDITLKPVDTLTVITVINSPFGNNP